MASNPWDPNQQAQMQAQPGAAHFAGWDPFAGAQSYWMPKFDPSATPREGWSRMQALTTGAPQRLDDFRRQADPLISEQWRGSLLEMLSTMAGQQRTGERQQTDQLAQFGISPAAALGQLIPQQRQASAEQQGALRGGAIAGEAGARMDLGSQLLSAMNEIESYYDSLRAQDYLASKGRSTARQGAKSAQMSSLIGGGLGALGMAGIPMGAAAGLSASQVGGFNAATKFNSDFMRNLWF